MTKQRKLVMDIIENSCCHPTAEQVFLKAKEQISGIAMATVYNNINYLLDEGLIRRISVIGQADRFDNVRIPHEHIKCDKCNKITDIFLGDMLDELKNKTGLKLTSYELNLHYVCDSCRNNDI